MVISTKAAWDYMEDKAVHECEHAVVYADMAGETVLHEGGVRVHANGWVELPTGRLLSPNAVHHIDTQSG